jgi:hypothetical protein
MWPHDAEQRSQFPARADGVPHRRVSYTVDATIEHLGWHERQGRRPSVRSPRACRAPTDWDRSHACEWNLFECALVNSLHRDGPRRGRVRIISVVAVFRRERVGADAAGKLVNAERG